MFPSNEAETVELYQATQNRLRWRIAHLQTAFPDAIIENDKGQRLVVEFEHLARNFAKHGHDPDGCDLVICWRNDWPGAPLPVWALDGPMAQEAAFVSKYVQLWRAEAEGQRAEATRLRGKVALLRQKLAAASWRAKAAMKGINPLGALNDDAFKRAVASVFVRVTARLDAQLEDFFED